MHGLMREGRREPVLYSTYAVRYAVRLSAFALSLSKGEWASIVRQALPERLTELY